MKEVKKLVLTKKTVQTLENSSMSDLKGGNDPLKTKIGGKCLGTPKPSSGFMSCA